MSTLRNVQFLNFRFTKSRPHTSVFNFTHYEQETDRTCWAACLQMILQYYCDKRYQCEITDRGLKLTKLLTKNQKCCNRKHETKKNLCGQMYPFDAIQNLFKDYGVSSYYKEDKISESTLIAEITNKKRPVLIGGEYYGSSNGHIFLVSDYGNRHFTINDPEKDTSQNNFTFDALKTFGGKNVMWKYTWIEIQN